MLAWLERRQLLLLAFALLVLAAAFVAQGLGRSSPPGQLVFQEGTGAAEGTPIKVEVRGGVRRPGVYDLREGDRVADAIAAAGGPSEGANLDAVNLARRVHDEQQLVIPGRSSVTSVLNSGRLDINSASQTELDALPGVGEAYSRRIVDSRLLDGPYRSPDDLVARKVLPQATLERIRDLITVVAP
jgi:competence protein ComEA